MRDARKANHRLICAWRSAIEPVPAMDFEFWGKQPNLLPRSRFVITRLDQAAMGNNSGIVWRSIASRLSILRAIACAMAVSACSQGSTFDPINASATSPTNSESQICRPDRALLAPQPAPDCGFGRADLKTLDPEQWARLKLEYELKCYKEAEKTARQRLRLLQAANKCEALAAR